MTIKDVGHSCKRSCWMFRILFFAPFFFSSLAGAKELKVGFVYVDSKDDAGWSVAHEKGRMGIEAMDGVTTDLVDNVRDNAFAETVIKFYAENKYDLIFTTSFSHMDPTLAVAINYPNVVFMHCSGMKRRSNVGTYFGRIYQARYLTGIVAGLTTKTNRIGYVAAFQIPEIIRGINAFTLGALSVNPDAEIYVKWTEDWNNGTKAKEATLQLLEQKIDVITQHQDSPIVQILAQEKGIHSIGYHADMSKFAPDAHLVAAVWNWEILYKQIVRQVQNGTWKSERFWWGLKKGLVDISPFGKAVSAKTQKKVLAVKKEIIQNRKRIFAGPVVDFDGKIRIPANHKITDSELLSMDWFVQGVRGK